MKLSTKGRYATSAMLDLALNYRKEPVVLKDIAERQQISEQYLEHLIGFLKVAGLVKSVRGANGGFMLVKSPSEIKVSHIIQAVEGSTALVKCVDNPHVCPRSDECLTRSIWTRATKAVDDVFDSISLQNLIDKAEGVTLPSGGIM